MCAKAAERNRATGRTVSEVNEARSQTEERPVAVRDHLHQVRPWAHPLAGSMSTRSPARCRLDYLLDVD